MKKQLSIFAMVLVCVFLLAGCSSPTDEQLEARSHGIQLMLGGDYDGAIAEFESLISSAKKVTDFEVDVLKYRAEAEYKICDFEAAAYTYDILNQVDKERAEYDYNEALCYAKLKDLNKAKELLDAGRALDAKAEKPGYGTAMSAYAEGLLECGDRESAKAICQELIELGLEQGKSYNRLALMSMQDGDYEQALAQIEAGLQSTVEVVGVNVANDMAENALSYDVDNRRSLKFNEAVCYEYLGEYDKALTLFRAFVYEFGEDESAAHEIAFLETR